MACIFIRTEVKLNVSEVEETNIYLFLEQK